MSLSIGRLIELIGAKNSYVDQVLNRSEVQYANGPMICELASRNPDAADRVFRTYERLGAEVRAELVAITESIAKPPSATRRNWLYRPIGLIIERLDAGLLSTRELADGVSGSKLVQVCAEDSTVGRRLFMSYRQLFEETQRRLRKVKPLFAGGRRRTRRGRQTGV
jgi:hypothetical protein